ncbi:conserved Plasmodium protein, unknown function [Plasmodium ovale]|uniref:Uncharacterized protein n=2 Tax=Plasmodium ovale TaxID=36330 RepID=A0A1A8WGC6_PLAOA|nr:conserved Plasmodium protein, unknown function [Plasmodium ovale curtisi]SBS90854.1 conserved Plasmodium protein, unknown function [Plasmodium ovale curtisi]SCQ16115.1 conserved Plasmodium protein, unknown function [Plasmodium ovale]
MCHFVTSSSPPFNFHALFENIYDNISELEGKMRNYLSFVGALIRVNSTTKLASMLAICGNYGTVKIPESFRSFYEKKKEELELRKKKCEEKKKKMDKVKISKERKNKFKSSKGQHNVF